MLAPVRGPSAIFQARKAHARAVPPRRCRPAAQREQSLTALPPAWQTYRADTSSSNGAGASTSGAPSARVFYNTSWPRGKLHGSLQGGPWQDFPLQLVTSAPGKWLAADVPVPAAGGSNGAPLLEFVVTDGHTWDKPAPGGNYVVPGPGVFAISDSQIRAVSGPPVMVVSDLDGTMVGDDAATAAFKDWWETTGVLRGGVLAYNTGRALASFEQLLASKASCLAHPDILISAVGTKVYLFTPEGRWNEDKAWSSQLDQGWNVGAVREAAYSALAKVGKDSMHFRPPEEQNEHKITCGVNTSVLQQVQSHIESAASAAGVAMHIITSGTGDWRFLDLVPKQAGKLEALEYVRQRYGFPLEATVACGDSGNDILMLSGPNLALAVGNSQPDLVTWLEQHKAEPSPLPGKQRLFRAQRHEAYGILEGLQHFGLA